MVKSNQMMFSCFMQIHIGLEIIQTTPSEHTTDKLIPIVCSCTCYSVSIKKLSVSYVAKVVLRVCQHFYIKKRGKEYRSSLLHIE